MRRTAKLLAPELLCTECANTFWKHVARGLLTADEAAEASAVLAAADIELTPLRPLMAQAARLAVALNHPAYDGFYLALAIARDCAVVTADQRFAAAARRLARGPAVKLLSELA